ncbi:hypothetical protein [Bradyrhizobium sp. CCBAU 53415]|uniref:hypothetical protein n=1 Tax=Bradyrhizobium sp. CCBAU 53415 TaxID=1325119 RepID=UPI0023062D4C|nr:hypothetical protein [Bradyrhizobium sp. CCBAU 53415]
MEHDYSMSIDDCPRCRELRSLVHDMNAPPSECRACIEFGRERSRTSRGTHIPGIASASAGNIRGRVVDADAVNSRDNSATGHTFSPTRKATDSISLSRAREAAMAAVDKRRAAAASWDDVVAEVNRQIKR